MASKGARKVVCYCLEHPEALEDKKVAKLYESAKKELDDQKIVRSKLSWYEKKELYFKNRPELEKEIKSLIEIGKTNDEVRKIIHIDVKAVAYVRRKYKLFKPADISKRELEKMYSNKKNKDIREELGISQNTLSYLLQKYKIKSKRPVLCYKVKATFETGEVKIFNSTADAAAYIGISKSGLSHRLKAGTYIKGMKLEKQY